MTEIFPIAPAAGRTLWFFALLGGLMLALALLFAWFAYASVSARFELSDGGLRIRSAVYGRTIPAHALRVDEARVVNLREERQLQLSMRTNGIGMPGYAAGWFRLRGGGRALAFLTRRESVVHIPTSAGYDLLLSPREPDAFLRSLQQVRGSDPS